MAKVNETTDMQGNCGIKDIGYEVVKQWCLKRLLPLLLGGWPTKSVTELSDVRDPWSPQISKECVTLSTDIIDGEALHT